jgi:hypothetical protein
MQNNLPSTDYWIATAVLPLLMAVRSLLLCIHENSVQVARQVV